MERFEKRNEIRIAYQLEIINLLREGKKTITELAHNLGISFTALSNIVDELVKTKLLICSEKKQSKTRGRNPVYVEINCDDGVICSIDFSSYDIRIAIASLDSKIIVEDYINDVKFITKEHLEQIEQIINTLLRKPEVKNRKLLSICIASPGLIRPDNYEFVASRRLQSGQTINPASYFTNAFNVKVEMHNDVRVGCLAEMKYGAFPKKLFNGLFVHIGFSSGLALIINGKIYEGSNGFSGETPVFYGDDKITQESQWNTRFFPICEIDSAIKRYRNIPIGGTAEYINLNKIIEDYKKDDEITVKAVDESAKRNAMTLFGLATVLDIDYVVIEGKILEFGSEYIDLIRKDINTFSSMGIRTRIATSGLKEECSTLGACYHAATMHFLDAIEKITKERIDLPEFELGNRYKEI